MSSPRVVLEPCSFGDSSVSLVEEYLAERSLSLVPRGVKAERVFLARFFDFLKGCGVSEVGSVELRHLDAYQKHLETTPGKRGKLASRSYLLQHLGVARGFLVWCEVQAHTLVDFRPYAMPAGVKREMTALSVEQVRKLLEAPDPATPRGFRDRLILESFYTLALRRSESFGLNLSDVNLSERTLRAFGKGQTERLLPMSDRLTELFRRYIGTERRRLRPGPDEQSLWVSPLTGRRLSFGHFKKLVQTYAKRAGLFTGYPHLLRHACATHMLCRGAHLAQVSRFLGHTSLYSTQRYTHLSELEIRRELKRCHPRFREVTGDA